MAKVTDLGGSDAVSISTCRLTWTAPTGRPPSATRSTGIAAPRAGDAIYGMHSQLTITGAFVNATLFEQAGVDMPADDATWEEWAEASRAVAEATDTPFPHGHRPHRPPRGRPGDLLRRGHRLGGWHPHALGRGLRGLRRAVRRVERGRHHGAGRLGRTGRRDLPGTQHRNSSTANWCSTTPAPGRSGRMDEQVGDFFDWQVVGSPCGPAGLCSGMPGGAGIVGFEQTEHPEAVAARDRLPRAGGHLCRGRGTHTQPAGTSGRGRGRGRISRGASPAAAAALSAFAADLADVAPAAFRYQGYAGNRAMFGITAERVSQAIVGRTDGRAGRDPNGERPRSRARRAELKPIRSPRSPRGAGPTAAHRHASDHFPPHADRRDPHAGAAAPSRDEPAGLGVPGAEPDPFRPLRLPAGDPERRLCDDGPAATCFWPTGPDVGLRNFAHAHRLRKRPRPQFLPRGQVLARGVEHDMVRDTAGRLHGGLRASDRDHPQPRHPRARLLPGGVLLSGAAVARRRGADLEMDSPSARAC